MSVDIIPPGYTDVGKIRAALGMTDNELLDEFFDQGFGIAMELDLMEWLPDHATIWDAYKASGASAEDRQKGMTLEMYALWFCAAQVSMMWLAMPQRISDGKADMRRFTEVDLKALAENAAGNRDKYKQALQVILDPNTTIGYTQIASARPSFDPVTGEQQ